MSDDPVTEWPTCSRFKAWRVYWWAWLRRDLRLKHVDGTNIDLIYSNRKGEVIVHRIREN